VRVTGNVVNLRSGPGTSYSVIGSMRLNDRVNPMARSADANWIKVGTQVGATGWAYAPLLEIDGGWINRLPVESVQQSYQALVPNANTPIFALASDASGIIAYANNETVTVLGRSADTNYLYIRTAWGVQGWVWSYFVALEGTLIAQLPVLW
jgi:N-acetylmuramoyl-L-alanine amidase